jgi:hypothetical protein
VQKEKVLKILKRSSILFCLPLDSAGPMPSDLSMDVQISLHIFLIRREDREEDHAP